MSTMIVDGEVETVVVAVKKVGALERSKQHTTKRTEERRVKRGLPSS